MSQMNDGILGMRLIESLLGRTTPKTAVRDVLPFLESLKGALWTEAGESIAAYFADRCGEEDISTALADLDRSSAATARFVRARVLAYRGESRAAVEEFGKTSQLAGAADADVLLHRARLLLKLNDVPEAVEEFRSALRLHPPYSFFIRGEKVMERLIGSGQWQPRRVVKVALLSSSTTAFLATVFRAAGFRNGLKFDIQEGVYGNYRQDILNPDSELYRFNPEIVLLILNHRDLRLPPSGGRAQADRCAAELSELWRILLERNPCHIVQVGFDVPLAGAWGSLEDTLPEGRRRVIERLNSSLIDNLPAGISYLDPNALASEIGSKFQSAADWCKTKQYPSLAALPRFADALYSHCAAALGLGAKVLALDLDNTLWGGIIGEDLLGGIRIGPPTAEGEGYYALQEYAAELRQRGVLLAVCSKNNREDAELPFREHDGMKLKLDDFVAFEANWQDKATNLQKIAEDLALGLDSFVFLDDNPLERAWVRARLPQVTVLECGSTSWEMLTALRCEEHFQCIALTREDVERHESYLSNAARNTFEKSAASLDEFLAGLAMVAEHGPVDDKTLSRVVQLINKTNQFNLTARRYAEEQVRVMAGSPDWWCHWFRLADCFGDHGLIGAILARKGKPQWCIDTWLMSCRVLGRNMERFMARTLLLASQREGAEVVAGEYIPTAKNAIVKNVYPQLGFEADDAGPNAFVFDLKCGKPVPECAFIQEKHQSV
jgi:FkbH-like protein